MIRRQRPRRHIRARSENLARVIELNPWHASTNTKVKRFSPLMDSKFRAGAPPQLLMRRCRWPRNSWTRKVAKSSLRSRLGPPAAPGSAGGALRKEDRDPE